MKLKKKKKEQTEEKEDLTKEELRLKKKKEKKISKANLKLLSSLERIPFYLFLVFFALFLFTGYVSSSLQLINFFYRACIFISVFNFIFVFLGFCYSIYESIRFRTEIIQFLFFSLLRVVVIIVLLIYENLVFMLSKGELFNV